jgi:hypothetical protein
LTRADGAVTTGLKQAIGVYRNVCYRAYRAAFKATVPVTLSRMSACGPTAIRA